MSSCLLSTKAAKRLIMGKCRSTAVVLYKSHHPRLLTLCWRSVDALLIICWRSVGARLTLCWHALSVEAMTTLIILPITAANISIMDKCRSAALGWHMMQHTQSLTLCWRSVSDWGCDHVAFSLPINATNPLIMGKCRSTAFGLYKMQHTRLLTLCSCSVDALLTVYWCSVDAVLILCWSSLSGEATSTLII